MSEPNVERISIVIPTYKRNDDLRRLIQSILKSNYLQSCIEIIIVDNANDDNLKKMIDEINAGIILIQSKQNLYSNGARRLGADRSTGDFIFLLDDDNVLDTDALKLMVDAMNSDTQLGAVGPLMLESDTDIVWSAGGRLSWLGLPVYLYKGKKLSDLKNLPKMIPNIAYFPNACFARRAALEKAGLDDITFPHNWAETDFCLNIINAGYDIACVTSAIDRHYIGYGGMLTRVKPETIYDQSVSRILFRRRHLNRVTDWIKFWIIIFPLSTILYLRAIARSEKLKKQMLFAYFRGVKNGIFNIKVNGSR